MGLGMCERRARSLLRAPGAHGPGEGEQGAPGPLCSWCNSSPGLWLVPWLASHRDLGLMLWDGVGHQQEQEKGVKGMGQEA